MSRAYFLLVLSGMFAAGFIFGDWFFEKEEPPLDCEKMSLDLWAFQQCLNNRPACHIQGGQQAYADYHEMRNRFEIQCGADRGDSFLNE